MADDESFKVTDRRGRPREETDPPGEPPETTQAPSTASSSRGGDIPPAGPGSTESHAPDLQDLFVMFASSALISMGEAADPSTGQRTVDLDQARHAIDLLVLLRDKTSGNRTDEESRLLEHMLYDLQMRFVRVAEASR